MGTCGDVVMKKALNRAVRQTLKDANGRSVKYRRLYKMSLKRIRKELEEEEVDADDREKMEGRRRLKTSKSARRKLFTDVVDELTRGGKVTIEDERNGKDREEGFVSYVGKKKRKREPTTMATATKEMVEEKDRKDRTTVSDDVNGSKQHSPYSSPSGDNTILLFYAYCPQPMSREAVNLTVEHCYRVLSQNLVTGRLRIAREGYNATLTGSSKGIRAFTTSLVEYDPQTFGNGRVDFKYVDNQPDNQLLKGLKVWPVLEIVTYGLNSVNAPLEKGGVHLPPEKFHEALAEPNSVVVDIRNFNETIVGRFAPPGGEEKVLDPRMRRSTEFPDWVMKNRDKLEGKKVLLYCTGGVRCERASAFMQHQGISNVHQLEGGIHRYLDRFMEDGGYWIGKNYTFDKRFNHGAKNAEVISQCVICNEPWDRYQARKKCIKCKMEVLLCKTCQKTKPPLPKGELICPLCSRKRQTIK